MSIGFPRLGQMGRLGNQLFQVGAAASHAKRCDSEPRLPRWAYTNVFNVPLEWFSPAYDGHDTTWREPQFGYVPIPVGTNIGLEGYFQSWRYLDEPLVRSIFAPRDHRWSGHLLGVCAIHVRRGDYLQKPDYHTNLPMAYYDRAIGFMEATVHPIGYFVFSDDMPWCREHFTSRRFIFITDEFEDFEALLGIAACEYQIIANSAFSWWGAWLNASPHKNVVTPPASRWFGPAGPKDTQDLLPPDWHEVDWA